MTYYNNCGTSNNLVKDIVYQTIEEETADLQKLHESMNIFVNSIENLINSKHPDTYLKDKIEILFEEYKPVLIESAGIPELEEQLLRLQDTMKEYNVDINKFLYVTMPSIEKKLTGLLGNIFPDEVVQILPKFAGQIQRTQEDHNREKFYIKDFGAKGDGVTDDRIALHDAIRAANEAGGGEVILNSTTDSYAMSLFDPLRNIHHVTINGNGQEITIIDPSLYANRSERSPLLFKDSSHIRITNLIVEGGFEKWVNLSRRINNTNITFIKCSNVQVDHCILANSGYPNDTIDEAGDAIVFKDVCNHTKVFNNIFINPGRWSIVLTQMPDNVYDHQYYDNIQLVTRPSKVLGFVDLELEDWDHKFPMTAFDISIRDNVVYFGCMIATSNGNFENLEIHNNKFYGHTWTPNPEDRVYKDDNYPYGFGFMNELRPDRPVNKNFRITNNLFHNIKMQNIHLQGVYKGVIIEGNKITHDEISPLKSRVGSGITVKNAEDVIVRNNEITVGSLDSDSGSQVVPLRVQVTKGYGIISNNLINLPYSQAPVDISANQDSFVLFSENTVRNIKGSAGVRIDPLDASYNSHDSSRFKTTYPIYLRNNTLIKAPITNRVRIAEVSGPSSTEVRAPQYVDNLDISQGQLQVGNSLIEGFKYSSGDVVINSDANSDIIKYHVTSSGFYASKPWTEGSTVTLNQSTIASVYPSLRYHEGSVYQAVTSGTMGTQPPTHTTDGAVSDGGVEWEYVGPLCKYKIVKGTEDDKSTSLNTIIEATTLVHDSVIEVFEIKATSDNAFIELKGKVFLRDSQGSSSDLLLEAHIDTVEEGWVIDKEFISSPLVTITRKSNEIITISMRKGVGGAASLPYLNTILFLEGCIISPL